MTRFDLSIYAVSSKSSTVHNAWLNFKGHRRPELGYICLTGFEEAQISYLRMLF